MNTYQREGKNEHDDAPDAVTGLGEMVIGEEGAIEVFKK